MNLNESAVDHEHPILDLAQDVPPKHLPSDNHEPEKTKIGWQVSHDDEGEKGDCHAGIGAFESLYAYYYDIINFVDEVNEKNIEVSSLPNPWFKEASASSKFS